MVNIYEQVAANKRKSFFILVGFMAIITAMSWVMAQSFQAGPGFVVMAMFISLVMSFGSYYFSDRIILTMSGARPADREKDFDFFTVTENLAMAARLPMPKLYVIEDTSMNAFATGRNPEHAVVVATTGLLSRLNRSEIEGVVAHELGHVKNFDIRTMALVSVLVGMITLLADWLLRMSFWGGRNRDENQSGQAQMIMMFAGFMLAFLSPLIATLIKLAVSRSREYLADATAVSITKYPEGLASALEKLSKDREPLEAANKATAHLYITNPLTNLKGSGAVGLFAGMFSTHPPIEERIKRLKDMR